LNATAASRCRPGVDVLELVRAQWAAVVGAFASPALVIISGYRDPAYNKRIGGATHSQHMNGSAADLRPVRIGDVAKLADVVDEMIADGRLPSLGGFGKYMGWIHLDTWRHPSGKLRRWNGAGVGSEPA
jgi:uncharacterized protein YcbK (DUF882 family)